MDAKTYVAASVSGQSAIIAWGGKLAVDGKWGRFTNEAYLKLSPDGRKAVDSALARYGVSASDLMAFRAAQKKSSTQRPISGDVMDAIRKAAEVTGVDESLLLGFARIESGLNPLAVNGQSRGLMQMQPAAWADARRLDPGVAGYDKVFDAYSNARAGAVYLKINIRRLTPRLGRLPDAAELYLAHQQGAGGFLELFNAANGGPTGRLVTEQAMLRNPPPDGRGATKDKAEFYRRWYAIAKRRI